MIAVPLRSMVDAMRFAFAVLVAVGAGCGSRSLGEADYSAGLASISMGDSHGCVLAKGGSIWCWGGNHRYELGGDTPALHDRPILATTVPDARALSAGAGETCVVGGAESVLCWGSGARDPRSQDDAIPRTIAGLSGVVSVATGWFGNCALSRGRDVSCWSSVDPTPRKVEALAAVKSLGLGGMRGCALLQTGEVRCFDPTTRVVDERGHASNIETLAVGFMRACGITRTGTVSCWFTDPGFDAIPIAGIANARALAVNSWNACALSSSGEVQCWDMGATTTGPIPVEGLEDVTAFSSRMSPASNTYCAILGRRTVSCWEVDRSLPSLQAKAQPGFPL